MATLRDYFDTDFSSVLHVFNTLRVQNEETEIEVKGRVHLDFNSNATYLSCYVPECENFQAIHFALIRSIDKLLGIASDVEVDSGFVGERPMCGKGLRFAGRLFIYTENEISDPHLDLLQHTARASGIVLQLRGPLFARQRSALEKPVAFVSHDSRDKDSVARPIAVGLSKRMCRVWFDEFSLQVGDRLRQSIEKGLRECKKCILVLSPNFLSNPGWTKVEFDSIFARELVEGRDLVLPVWHGVSRDQVFDYSAALVDRIGISWDLGEEEVVRRLHRAITI